jgi:biotin-dependent carboxylase-like uncharacterized protein
MGKLTVLDGGLFTSIQDKGRFGFRKYGVPTSGVMDQSAYFLANKLVGNDLEEPVLECTLKGGKYVFNSDTSIAITGALMRPRINDNAVEMNTVLHVQEGDVLNLKFAERGCRSYISIRGSWNVPDVMGSLSTYVPGNFGGITGSKLKEGDEIFWTEIDIEFDTFKSQNDQIPYYSSKISVDFIPGPEWSLLSKEDQKMFLSNSFKISSKSNRMGIRLETEYPIKVKATDMSSSGVIPGIIQLPPEGKPIILMRDGQTIGGYPRIGKVLDIHLNRLAQLPPNATVRFSLTSLP